MATEPVAPPLGAIAADAFRVLFFLAPSPAIAAFWPRYLAFGLSFTWLAGIGRYWDNPRAEAWQLLGLGSLAYVFCLAAVLWLLVLPLRPQRWSYRGVLVFVTLTSPPALLYAIPVETFMPLPDAQAANAWFLAIVATWRVALLAWFLRRVAALSRGKVFIATFLPLTLIVFVLATLNLEHVVFNLMAGIADPSGNDAAYQVVFTLALWSIIGAPILLLAYVVAILEARRGRGQPETPGGLE